MTHKIVLIAITLCAISDSCSSTSTFCKNKLNSPDKDEANIGRILKELSALNLATEVKNGTGPPIKYKVAVCGDASSTDSLAGAIRTSQSKETVLGRVNNTEVVLGDSWMMVILGDGDSSHNGTSCNGTHTTTVLFWCNEKSMGDLHFVKELKPNKTSEPCSCIMEVESSIVCPHKELDNSTSHSFVFFSIVFCIILVYFVCGALYRRFALGAKGLEQIPHIAFWSQLFENCRMFCCRRRRNSNSLWHGNDERDDDSLLQP